MDIPTALIDKYRPRERKAGDPRSHRDELLNMFLAELNPPRVLANFKPYTPARLMKLLEGIPDTDWYPFFKECQSAKSFSKFFHWSLKPRNEIQGN